jgi:TIR domain
MNSDICLREASLARQRYETGETLLVAVVLRPCRLEDVSLLTGIPVLPTTGKPVFSPPHHIDEALLNVTRELSKLLPPTSDTAVEILYCYAREDEKLRDELAKYLEPLRRSGEITTWHDRKILPGAEWKQEIDTHLDSADIILLLVSPNFMASRYCYTVEMQRALERHQKKDARVIPVILNPVDWQNTPLEVLQALPRDGKPITLWRHRSQAFSNVVEGIHKVIEAHTQSTS